jgi:uncharacterized protein (TIGR02284 family)
MISTETNQPQPTAAPATQLLRGLLQVNVDSAKCFETAAMHLQDPCAQQVMRDLAEQRHGFARDIQTRIATANDDPREAGTVNGLLHRWWMELKNRFSSTDNFAVLAEVQKNEADVRQRYEAAQAQLQGLPLEHLLAEHLAAVRGAHEKVSDLCQHFQEREKPTATKGAAKSAS